ncbi:MAG: sorbose reductase [Gammaproteobacteria bacterium]|nr:sorbose reductase [Gammaproteobacteria bacterium]
MERERNAVSQVGTEEYQSPLVHITSFIVHAQPGTIDLIGAAITRIPGAEIHCASAAGKLIVLLETTTLQDVIDANRRISAIAGVLNTSMVFHQVEAADELDQVI